MSKEILKSESKECEDLLEGTLATLKDTDVNNDNQSDLLSNEDQNLPSERKECGKFTNQETLGCISTVNQYETNIKRRSTILKKSLFAFRVTQFLWYGSSGIPGIFLGVFLKGRGLSLVELSSAYSVIFFFQVLTSFVTGIIADKIGNAKPLLIFLMTSTPCVLFSMLLTPNINNPFCFQLEKNLSCSKLLDTNTSFLSCYNWCLSNYSGDSEIQQIFPKNFSLENASLVESFDFTMRDNETDCDFSTNATLNYTFNLQKHNCCYVCANDINENCKKERKSYLVAVYAFLIVLFYSVYSTGHRFMNFIAVSLAVKSELHLGKELAIAKCGQLSVIIITAFVLNIDKSSGSDISYDPLIWITAGIQIIAIFTSFFINVPCLSPGKKMLKKGLNLMKDVKILAFILLVFVAGNGYAFNRTLLLVFLGELNAPSTVIALHSVVAIVYGFPVLLTSKWWLKKFGTNKLFVLGLLAYTVENISYSFLVNSWWALLIDVTTAFSNHLFWVIVIQHCYDVAPVGFSATLNGLAGSVHYGIGRSSGVFFGGMLMNYLGKRNAYRVMSATFFSTAVLYSIFIFTRRNSQITNSTENGIKDKHTKDMKCSKNRDEVV